MNYLNIISIFIILYIIYLIYYKSSSNSDIANKLLKIFSNIVNKLRKIFSDVVNKLPTLPKISYPTLPKISYPESLQKVLSITPKPTLPLNLKSTTKTNNNFNKIISSNSISSSEKFENEEFSNLILNSPEKLVRNTLGTNKIEVEYSKIYPIGINFDVQFNNYSNLLENSSINLLNEIFSNVKYKANEKSKIINFNPNLKNFRTLILLESEIIDYGKYLVTLMNSVAIMGNSFVFKKINPITKDQYENQIRINFQIEVQYNYPQLKKIRVELIPKNFTILIDVVILFDKSVNFKSQNKYLESFSLIGITNYGFLPGINKNP